MVKKKRTQEKKGLIHTKEKQKNEIVERVKNHRAVT